MNTNNTTPSAPSKPGGIHVNLSVNVEFITLARSMRDAQKGGATSQRDQRRARSLEQLFDAKLAKLEEEVKRLQALLKQPELPMDAGKTSKA